MTDDKLATAEPAPIAAPAQQTAMLSIIERAAKDPTVDVDKLERLLAIQDKVMADAARTAFMQALARLQADLPQIRKDGRIVVKGNERSRYARLEDIDTAIRPLLAAEGFALSFDSSSPDGKLFTFSCRLMHRDGHSETKTLTLPLDKSDYRSDVQSIGSSETYAKRRLIKMHLNIIERDEDDDGNGGQRPVTQEQADTLRNGLGDLGGSEDDMLKRAGKFLSWLGAETFESILARDFDRAMKFLEEKKRGRK